MDELAEEIQSKIYFTANSLFVYNNVTETSGIGEVPKKHTK